MKLLLKAAGLIGPAIALGLVVTLVTCQPSPAPSHAPDEIPHAQGAEGDVPPASVLESGSSSVQVYIKTLIDTRYGFLAHLSGKRDNVARHTQYDRATQWWNNPLLVYEEVPHQAGPDVSVGCDGAEIAGGGASTNVAVRLLLIPHAEIAVRSLPKCDAVKGTITVSIAALGAYYDERWTEMARVEDEKVTFNFNTCARSRQVVAVHSETRAVPAFLFERYTRGHQKWEPRHAWPHAPASGDWRIVIAGKDARLDVTAYRYAEQSASDK